VTTRYQIMVVRNGPYEVVGNVPLVEKTQVVSEYGEPLTWKKTGELDPGGVRAYSLCRCGRSKELPYCDNTHRSTGFDGSESAVTSRFEERAHVLPGGTLIVVKSDPVLCMESGFCRLRDVGIEQLVTRAAEPRVRSLVIAMVERCPSGSLCYAMAADEPDVEPDLPAEIALTKEITSHGAIQGPLWVTGGIPVRRADGRPFETRNRVTLCRCGHSGAKPLCDGTHRTIADAEARLRQEAG
jgi:CDGSH-type Zn-finger protein